jgi:N-acetylglucosaminyldiphosphoundecaprenol N-acetyl-beta-D-mannosaminyltransferase
VRAINVIRHPRLAGQANTSTRRFPGMIHILGFRLHPRTGLEVVQEVADAVDDGRRLIMANTNLHAMAAMYESPAMARLLVQDDAIVMIDSMPLIFLAKMQGKPLSREKRTTSLDFYDDLFRVGAGAGWRFGYVGADPDTLARGLDILRERFPALDIDGRDGFFDAEDFSPGSRLEEVVAWLNQRDHDVVIVGMGMPRQEEWIERVQHLVGTRVFLPAGAYLDYQVGVQTPT